jgi:hypothetical protein
VIFNDFIVVWLWIVTSCPKFVMGTGKQSPFRMKQR